MGLKRLTHVFVVSCALIAWDRSTGGVLARAADEAATPEQAKINERHRALELLRQAVAELHANRIDAARSLAKQASELIATYSLLDVRPEPVLAEIDRKERNGDGLAGTATSSAQDAVQTRKPTGGLVAAAADPTDPLESPKPGTPVTAGNDSTTSLTQAPPATKAAIEQQPQVSASGTAVPTDQRKVEAVHILERGLQALDERRLDDAEREARAALSLHASFSKFEYKPEYLITEVGIARARLRLDAATSPKLQSSAPATSTSSMIPRLSPANGSQATSTNQRAEQAVSQALSDLHAGRDEMARSQMQTALSVIQTGAEAPTPGSVPAQSPVGGNETSQFLPNSGAGLPVPPAERVTGQVSEPRGVANVRVQPTGPVLQPDVVSAFPGELPFYSLDCAHCDTTCQPPKLCPCYLRGIWTGAHGE